ncbi:substrate-binding domain-containing protein [uncultured Planktomarina sp.]|uniref:substrate-binding domain-containing protein n=1 Tax=uncultured Planktomarina sp. TaxID=1538529 RepID=UPI003260C0EE
MYKFTTTLITAALSVSAGMSLARDQIQIAGSSTVLPYASIVAEAFGENFDYLTPVVESGGSSGGMKRFCTGLGENTIDIANSSRRIKDSEIAACAEQGVTEIIEVRIGYDGIVFASDFEGQKFAFHPVDIYQALAAQLPMDGEMRANSYANWSEIDAKFTAQPIQAYIPGTKHGTREVFEEKILLAGCEASGALAEILSLNGGDSKAAKTACMTVRNDGYSVDIDGDYTETLASIASNKNGIGVFGLSFYENNTDKLQVATISDVMPSTESISSGDYPVSRPLYFYIKKAHISIIPGLKDYAAFFTAEEIAGPDGPLAEYGLVADPLLEQTQEQIKNETIMR